MIALRRTCFDTPCTVELEHSDEFLCAHVALAGDVAIGPGDRVRVHGAPISVGFGERRVVERIATVERASTVERWWTKFAGHFEMAELYEVSFSDRKMP
ncbi:hypothetical protein [Sphingomonas sanxanigenens]|uniref:Uncharacterized protein n=1 Tax=Sphingomonas sanxanigenens DSM 19645 = NX02 TaxID=1123269 RepID=W0AFM7_9SPHN|nr:hypothetical protein [Sphingomonas sanxanigenens]AHE55347.1 hypothetical protein NX02_18390 [Sphingomonas sanxanigenens DSM 19645 = NX02]